MPDQPHDFLTTHWSIVALAGEAASPDSAAALEKLCRAYWFPLYAYVRRRGSDADDARDLTQGFFEKLLEKNYVADADARRGRFRTFLLTSLSHFLANEWNRANAKKRGGGATTFSLDETDAEDRYLVEPADDLTPERIFDRRWAEAVLDAVFAQLRREFDDAGRGLHFDELKSHLLGDDTASYTALAAAMKMTETGARTVIHRMRKRFRALVRTEIANTVASPDEVDDELQHLFRALA